MPSLPSQSSTSAACLDPRWCQRSPDECVWVDCDDAFVVYHRPSGKTHLMNAASSWLLRDLLREPMSLGEIGKAMADESSSRSEEFLESLRAMLQRFEQLGLLERV